MEERDDKIISYYKGDLSEDEEMDLLHEAFANPELKSRMIDYQHVYSLVRLAPEKADLKFGKQKYDHFIDKAKSVDRRQKIYSLLRYAAVIMIFVFSTWMGAYLYFFDPVIKQVILQQELYVPAGQRAHTTLPDGSKVWLNADSRLSYPSVFGKERRVHLCGEAFFEIAKNKDAPFIVSTHSIEVEALGTEFNVSSYPKVDYTSVYLLNGSVRAYYPGSASTGVILKPTQYLIEKDGVLSLGASNPDDLLWKEGVYAFNNQKLGDIIKKLELYYDLSFQVNDPEILDYVYTGKFRQRDGIIEILTIFQEIHPFKVLKTDNPNRIILAK